MICVDFVIEAYSHCEWDACWIRLRAKCPECKCNFKHKCRRVHVSESDKTTLRFVWKLWICWTYYQYFFMSHPSSHASLTLSLLISFSLCLPFVFSACVHLQHSGRGLDACALEAVNPQWTHLWSSWAQRSLMRGSISAASAPSPLATSTARCHSSYGVSPSQMAQMYSRNSSAKFCYCSSRSDIMLYRDENWFKCKCSKGNC